MNEIKYLNKSRSHYAEGEPREFMVGFTPHRSGTYRIELSGDIETVDQFSTAIQVLEQAKEEDEVVVYIQTNGGSVDAGEAFIHALRKCSAPVHMVATGGVHSMGTHILMEADSIELSSGFHALIHCGQDGSYGRVNEYHSKSLFDADFRTRQFKESYEGMLSDEEMEDVLKGRDLWLDGKGWMERAQKRSNYFRAKMEAMMQAEDEAIIAEIEADSKPVKKPRKKAVKAVDSSPEL